MSDQPLDDRQSADAQARSFQPSVKKNSKAIPLKAVGVAIALIIGLGLGYVLGILAPITHVTGSSRSGQPLDPAFNRVPADNLFSSTDLFQDVGGSPVDPSKILFPSMDKSLGVQEGKGEQAGLPQEETSTASKAEVEAPPATTGEAAQRPQTTAAPKPVETPVIVTRQPDDQGADKQGKERTESKSAAEQVPGPDPSTWDTAPAPGSKKRDKAVTARPSEKNPTVAALQDKNQVSESVEKKEQFRLPGSLVVKIHNYSGVMTQWGLMVILDDSVVMARKTKQWNPSRSQTAEAFVAGLTGHLTPGSKIAVRDFLCKQADAGKKQKESVCLSHILYDWAGSPFNDLKEKLSQVSPGGHNNPCAAAAYTLKKDFGSVGTLKPRVLIVTAGTAKCAVKDVIKAAEQHASKDRIRVDVLGIGMGKKGQAAYSNLTKKSGSLLINVDKPADLDSALTRYAKSLKTRTMEKVEIRGEKTTANVNPEEEITLPPGAYTVVLPVVAGLNPSKRTVPNIRIVSEQTKVLDVRIKKGKPIITAGKK